MKNTYVKVGYIVTDDKEITEVVGLTGENGRTNLWYNNDPFGIINIGSFTDIEVESIEGPENAAMAESLANIVAHGDRGATEGVVRLIGDRLLIIKSTYPMEAAIQDIHDSNAVANERPINYFVDVADCDNDSEDFETMMEIFGLM